MHNKTIKKISVLALVMAGIVTSINANAAMVNFSLSGEIASLDTNNPFSLTESDLITVSGSYDDSDIGDGVMFVDFSTNFNNMEITIGNTIYTDAMDTIGGASLYFSNGIFDGVDYAALDDSFNSSGFLGLTDPVTGALLSDYAGIGFEGNWIASSFSTSDNLSVTTVPIPAPFWLLGSGLVLLAGRLRRK